jgi:hypothetical protein
MATTVEELRDEVRRRNELGIDASDHVLHALDDDDVQ